MNQVSAWNSVYFPTSLLSLKSTLWRRCALLKMGLVGNEGVLGTAFSMVGQNNHRNQAVVRSR